MPFKKGQSGNPSGRPGVPKEVTELARTHTTEAIETLAKWMRSDNPKAAVSSADKLLNRAWGMPTQVLAGDDENPLQLVVKTLADVLREQDGATKTVK